MQRKNKAGEERERPSRVVRASVSLKREVYSELERIAESKKVSVAWVLRDAVEKYMADQWPLFAGQGTEEAGEGGGR